MRQIIGRLHFYRATLQELQSLGITPNKIRLYNEQKCQELCGYFQWHRKKPLETKINYSDKVALDLLKKTIIFNPHNRKTIQYAIQHHMLLLFVITMLLIHFQGDINFI
jgi:hypothetical protein